MEAAERTLIIEQLVVMGLGDQDAMVKKIKRQVAEEPGSTDLIPPGRMDEIIQRYCGRVGEVGRTILAECYSTLDDSQLTKVRNFHAENPWYNPFCQAMSERMLESMNPAIQQLYEEMVLAAEESVDVEELELEDEEPDGPKSEKRLA